jgi:hypothetical protein
MISRVKESIEASQPKETAPKDNIIYIKGQLRMNRWPCVN